MVYCGGSVTRLLPWTDKKVQAKAAYQVMIVAVTVKTVVRRTHCRRYGTRYRWWWWGTTLILVVGIAVTTELVKGNFCCIMGNETDHNHFLCSPINASVGGVVCEHFACLSRRLGQLYEFAKSSENSSRCWNVVIPMVSCTPTRCQCRIISERSEIGTDRTSLCTTDSEGIIKVSDTVSCWNLWRHLKTYRSSFAIVTAKRKSVMVLTNSTLYFILPLSRWVKQSLLSKLTR